MAKSIRSKVKKRHRTVKRGVVKRELKDQESKLGTREKLKSGKLGEASTGYIRPTKAAKNAFRSDDPEAVIPQHSFRQGPDFRAQSVGVEAGYAVVGTKRPKRSGDAPTAAVEPVERTLGNTPGAAQDAGVNRLQVGSNQIVPLFSSKRAKRRLKRKSGVRPPPPHTLCAAMHRLDSACPRAQTDNNVFRWT
jgi:hypothetical protein